MWPLAAVIIIIASVGIPGYFQIPRKCVVTGCEDKQVFYKGSYIQTSHIKIRFDRVWGQEIEETTGKYYTLYTTCAEAPSVKECYLYGGSLLQGVREWGWSAFYLGLIVPMLVLGLTDSFYCGCCRSCKRNTRERTILILSGVIWTGLVISFVTVGWVGLIDNSSEKCLKTKCVVGPTLDPDGHRVNAANITMMTTKFTGGMMPEDLTHTYYDRA
jgi:hypothetical protein